MSNLLIALGLIAFVGVAIVGMAALAFVLVGGLLDHYLPPTGSGLDADEAEAWYAASEPKDAA